jgi:hypothetical protein
LKKAAGDQLVRLATNGKNGIGEKGGIGKNLLLAPNS